MKTVKYLLVILAGLFVMVACQKELSVESGLTGGLATGTLKDSLGDCTPVSINGTYIKDSTLRADNYVYVQVQVSAPGIYRITTDQQNGFSFRDSGYFSSAGLQTVKLLGIGKPILPIATVFNVNFGTSQCSFVVNVVDSAGTGGGTAAAYTFSNASGVCSNPNIQGTYQAGTPLTAANTVTLSVNVATPGTYNITTPTNNGMTFRGSGVFTTPGVATVTLTGSGTPAAGGTTPFGVTTGSSACAFTINVTSSGPSAVYTLQSSSVGGPCTAATTQGTYTAGTALNASNTITVQVNVTTAGAYNISTVPTNGISFTKAGTFTTTGVQSVVLQGSGTPAAAGSSTIGVAGGTSGCTVQLTVNPGSGTSGPTANDSAWTFRQGTRLFFGPVDTAYVETFPGFGTFLSVEGHTYATDSIIYLDIFLPGGTIAAGTYSTTNGSSFSFLNSQNSDIYEATPLTTGASMNIVISSYNSTTKIVTGTFSGNAMNASNTVVPITSGTFRARVGN